MLLPAGVGLCTDPAPVRFPHPQKERPPYTFGGAGGRVSVAVWETGDRETRYARGKASKLLNSGRRCTSKVQDSANFRFSWMVS